MNIELSGYIKNRMKELGFENYLLRPFKIDISAGQHKERFNAYNEYIFLVSDSIPADLIIHSDTEIFFSVIPESNRKFPIEFRGQISVESSATVDFSLEFLRVIPISNGK
jgi:hypothetical protein